MCRRCSGGNANIHTCQSLKFSAVGETNASLWLFAACYSMAILYLKNQWSFFKQVDSLIQTSSPPTYSPSKSVSLLQCAEVQWGNANIHACQSPIFSAVRECNGKLWLFVTCFSISMLYLENQWSLFKQVDVVSWGGHRKVDRTFPTLILSCQNQYRVISKCYRCFSVLVSSDQGCKSILI